MVLTKVTYPDLSEAIYTYVGGSGTAPDVGRPVLASADDPCYKGPGSRTNYVYNYDAVFDYGAGPYLVTGTTKEERNGVTNQLVASLPTGSGTEPQVLDGSGHEIGFKYDKGLLIKRVDEEGRISTFTYDQGGYGHLATETEPNGGTTVYVRDHAGRMLSKTDALGKTTTVAYNSYGFEISRTDELGRITLTTRNSQNQITRMDYPDASYETFTRNILGQVLAHRLRNGGTQTSVYYILGESGGVPGDLKTFTDAEGATSVYTWHQDGMLASIQNSRGFVTSYEYNWKGMVKKVTFPDSSYVECGYDIYGNLLSRTNELGKITSYTYDEYNYRRTVTDPLNRTTQFEYGLTPGCASCTFNAMLRKVTFPSGKIIEYTYDKTRKLLSTKQAPGTVSESVSTNIYGASGDLWKTTDPEGNITTFAFDLLHRKISQANALSETTQWTYDDVGNILSVIQPDGGTVTDIYDEMDGLVSSENANGEITSYAYDDAGNVITITDAASNVHSFEYDKLDRRVKLTYPDATYEEWTYDDSATIAQPYVMQRMRNAETLFKIADERNRDTAWIYSDATSDVAFTYNMIGKMTGAVSSAATHVYAYDDASQLLSETTTVASLAPFVVSYAYNVDGQRNSLTYPDGSIVTTNFTDRRQVHEIKLNGTLLASYGYALTGKRSSRAFSNGVTTDYEYDTAEQEWRNGAR